MIIGGVNCEESYKTRLNIRTLPASHHIQSSSRFLFLRNGHIDTSVPEEQSIWPSIHEKLYDSSSINKSLIHSIFYNGNSLTVGDKINKHVIDLLAWLMREEISLESLNRRCADIEININGCYRSFLASSSLVDARKACGNIFLSGESEGFSQMMAWLEMDSTHKTNYNHLNNQILQGQATMVSNAESDGIFDESKSHEDVERIDAILGSAQLQSISEEDQELVKNFLEDKKLRDQRSPSLQQLLNEDANYELSIADKTQTATTNEELESIVHSDILYKAYELSKYEGEVRRSVAGLVGRMARFVRLRKQSS